MKRDCGKRILGAILGILAPLVPNKSFAIGRYSQSPQNNRRKIIKQSFTPVKGRSHIGRDATIQRFALKKNAKLSQYGITKNRFRKLDKYLGTNWKNLTMEDIVILSAVTGIPVISLIFVLSIVLGSGGEEIPSEIANTSGDESMNTSETKVSNSSKGFNGLRNNYESYVSDRKLTNEELKQIQDIAKRFNMVPYEGNNCYAATAMCMVTDPRDLDERKKQLDDINDLNFREQEYKKIIDKIVELEKNNDINKKNEFLKTLQNNIKVLGIIGNQFAPGDVYEFYKSTYREKNLSGHVDDVGVFLLSLFNNESKMSGNLEYINLQVAGSEGKIFEDKDDKGNPSTALELSKHPHNRFAKYNLLSTVNGDTRSIVDCISNSYCLVDDNEFITDEFLPHLRGVEIEESPYDPKVNKKLTGIKESDSFSVQIGKKTPNETNPFGRLPVSKYQNENSKRDYLVSEIAVHTGNHWYEDILIYDKNTLNYDCPKIVAIIEMNNNIGMINGKIITGDNMKSELETIAKHGSLYRYREVKNDNSGIYVI